MGFLSRMPILILMGVGDWLRETGGTMQSDGFRRGLSEGSYELYRGMWRILGSQIPVGTHVFERNWEVLIVLDACRSDVLKSVQGKYDFLDNFDTIWSAGSHSREWLAKTFARKYENKIKDTAYITGNVFSEHTFSGTGKSVAKNSPFSPDSWSTVDADSFAHLDEVWRNGWNDESGTVLPEQITDRGIETWRSQDPSRMILHYMQPHLPFIPNDKHFDGYLPNDTSISEMNLQSLRHGHISRKEYEVGYKANLCRVLDSVQLFINNIDADKVVITADHGEALGEWKIYGHPIGFLHPCVRKVPWVVTSGTDSGNHTPSITRQTDDSVVEDRLNALGYIK
jgi:hypothetical protein